MLNRVLRPLLEQGLLAGASVMPLAEVEVAASEAADSSALRDWVISPSQISAPPLEVIAGRLTLITGGQVPGRPPSFRR